MRVFSEDKAFNSIIEKLGGVSKNGISAFDILILVYMPGFKEQFQKLHESKRMIKFVANAKGTAMNSVINHMAARFSPTAKLAVDLRRFVLALEDLKKSEKKS